MKEIKGLKKEFLDQINEAEHDPAAIEAQLDRAIDNAHDDYKVEVLEKEIQKIKEELESSLKEDKKYFGGGCIMDVIEVEGDEDHYVVAGGDNLFTYDEIVEAGFDIDIDGKIGYLIEKK